MFLRNIRVRAEDIRKQAKGGAEARNLKVILLIAKDNQRLGSEGKEGSVVLATNEIN